MNLESFESIIKSLGGVLAYCVLVVIFYSIWRGTQRQPGRTSGRTYMWLRSPWFYLFASLLFFGISAWGWKPLPQTFSTTARIWMLVLGSLFYFPGLWFVLWGRLTLGRNYFVSTSMGAQLFKDHQLVTSGPFAIVRHPMYFGLILAALGSLLLYHTWTSLLFAAFAPTIVLRARREELVLAAQFGEEWKKYCARVPLFFPRLLNLKGKTLIILAAAGSFTVALVHLAAIFIGPEAYRLLGAGEDFAAWAETGSIIPALITFGLVFLFAIFGCYALSGAGIIRKLPLLTLGLLGIAALYTLRGLALFIELGMVLATKFPFNALSLFYSAVSLAIGVIYFAGIKANWNKLRNANRLVPRISNDE